MARDHRHDCMSLKRIADDTWQLWCGCGTIITAKTVAAVTNLHSDHTIGEYRKEIYGADA